MRSTLSLSFRCCVFSYQNQTSVASTLIVVVIGGSTHLYGRHNICEEMSYITLSSHLQHVSHVWRTSKVCTYLKSIILTKNNMEAAKDSFCKKFVGSTAYLFHWQVKKKRNIYSINFCSIHIDFKGHFLSLSYTT